MRNGEGENRCPRINGNSFWKDALMQETSGPSGKYSNKIKSPSLLRAADYKTPRTTKLYDQLKKQNKTERRAPSRDVQPPRSREPLSGVRGAPSATCKSSLLLPHVCASPPGSDLCRGLETPMKSNLSSATPGQMPPPLPEPVQGF